MAKKQAGQSIRTQDGRFQTYIRTQNQPTHFAIGFRLAGAGRLDTNLTRILLSRGPIATLAASLEHKITKRLSQVRSTLDTEQQRQSKNTLAQIEHFIRLQSYMGADFLMPDMHAWPISPDLGVLLIRLVEAGGYDAVIEFGSGVSTVILAQALIKTAALTNAQPAPLLSFEHLEHYFEQTAAMLRQARLHKRVDLRLAPLVPFNAPNDRDYPYYDCGTALRELRERLNAVTPHILVLVDGPPAATGPQARYPALPALLDAFGDQAHFDLLMDDYIRPDERDILNRWQALLTEQGRLFQTHDYPKLEKQACLLQLKACPA